MNWMQIQQKDAKGTKRHEGLQEVTERTEVKLKFLRDLCYLLLNVCCESRSVNAGTAFVEYEPDPGEGYFSGRKADSRPQRSLRYWLIRRKYVLVLETELVITQLVPASAGV